MSDTKTVNIDMKELVAAYETLNNKEQETFLQSIVLEFPIDNLINFWMNVAYVRLNKGTNK